MWYLGRGRWGLAYLGLTVLTCGLLPILAHLGMLPVTVDPAYSLVSLLIALVGAVHCERIAARMGPFVPPAWFARWYVLVLSWGIPVAFAFSLRAFLWEPFNMPAASMEPSLRAGDHLLVSKYAYHRADPQRGDIAVFPLPSDSSTAYVKRLVGLPGDRIQMKAGSLYINGDRVPQEKVKQRAEEGGATYRETLSNGRRYLVRDLLEHSRVDDTEVFEVPSGHYFFLSDNRDNGVDSRIAGMMGYVPRENLVGPVVLIYWNSETQRLRLFDEN